MKTSIYWQDPKYAVGPDFILDPSLVLYLPLHRRDGAGFKSADTYGHLCAVTGALWRPSGRYFDGTDDRIECGTASCFDITGEITLEAWIKLDSSGAGSHHTFVSKYDAQAGAQKGWILWVTNGDILGCRLGKDTTATDHAGTTNIQDDRWHHVLTVYDGAYIKLFLDGQTEGADLSYSNGTTAHNLALTVGCRHEFAGYDVFHKGLMGEVRVYRRALTPTEVQYNYLATKWRYQQ